MEILKSVPSIGELSAASLIVEIGDFKDFSSGNKLASWLRIVLMRINQQINYMAGSQREDQE